MPRKIFCLCFCFIVLCCACGCRLPDVTTSDISVQDGDKYRTVTMEDYGVSFSVPDDWYVDMSEGTEVDMFCTNGKLHMAVYGFFTEDFAEDADYLDIWESQNETAMETFENIQELEHKAEFESDDKDLETALYSSEIKDIKQYSYYIFVSPKENPEVFLWVAFSGQPSKLRDNFDVLEDIVDSIEF